MGKRAVWAGLWRWREGGWGPIAALGTEIYRGSDEVRAGFACGVADVLGWIAERLSCPLAERAHQAAHLMSLLVGAIVTARSSKQPDKILAAARCEAERLLAAVGT